MHMILFFFFVSVEPCLAAILDGWLFLIYQAWRKYLEGGRAEESVYLPPIIECEKYWFAGHLSLREREWMMAEQVAHLATNDW